MDGTQTNTIRIIRKGNGLVQVDPARAILQSGQDFKIVNTTSEDAVIGFDAAAFAPKQAASAESLEKLAGQTRQRLAAPTLVDVPRGGVREFTAGRGPLYFEYDVMLLGSGHSAEGGSKPGGIVDP